MPKLSRPSSNVTMRDVAEAAGVSRMTVSRALRKNSSVSDSTRERILKIVRDMNYVPDQMAGSLTTKRSGFVATLLPSLNNLHFALTVQALTDELEEIGLQILLGHTDYSTQREEQMVETMLRRRPEAVVLSYDGHTDRTRVLLQEAGVPVVEVWETPDVPLNHTVGFSNRAAARTMTEALIAKGYRNIVFAGEADDDWTRGAARRQGFVDAMSAHGLCAERQIRFGPPPLSIDDGAALAPLLLEMYPEADCVFCVSDMPAFGLQSALATRGKSVPEDIGVVGFGNFDVSRYAIPAISTVEVDPVGIGRQAGRLIAQLLDQDREALPSDVHRVVDTRLSFRGSTR